MSSRLRPVPVNRSASKRTASRRTCRRRSARSPGFAPSSTQPIDRYSLSARSPARVSNVSSVRPARGGLVFQARHQPASQAGPPERGCTSSFATSARCGWFCGAASASVTVPASTPSIQPASSTLLPPATSRAVSRQNASAATPKAAAGTTRRRPPPHRRSGCRTASGWRRPRRPRPAPRSRSPAWRSRIPASSRYQPARGPRPTGRRIVSHRTGARGRTACRSTAPAVTRRPRWHAPPRIQQPVAQSAAVQSGTHIDPADFPRASAIGLVAIMPTTWPSSLGDP